MPSRVVALLCVAAMGAFGPSLTLGAPMPTISMTRPHASTRTGFDSNSTTMVGEVSTAQQLQPQSITSRMSPDYDADDDDYNYPAHEDAYESFESNSTSMVGEVSTAQPTPPPPPPPTPPRPSPQPQTATSQMSPGTNIDLHNLAGNAGMQAYPIKRAMEEDINRIKLNDDEDGEYEDEDDSNADGLEHSAVVQNLTTTTTTPTTEHASTTTTGSPTRVETDADSEYEDENDYYDNPVVPDTMTTTTTTKRAPITTKTSTTRRATTTTKKPQPRDYYDNPVVPDTTTTTTTTTKRAPITTKTSTTRRATTTTKKPQPRGDIGGGTTSKGPKMFIVALSSVAVFCLVGMLWA
nr:unnamed protein product [Spirometra erinaceieuropaei]